MYLEFYFLQFHVDCLLGLIIANLNRLANIWKMAFSVLENDYENDYYYEYHQGMKEFFENENYGDEYESENKDFYENDYDEYESENEDFYENDNDKYESENEDFYENDFCTGASAERLRRSQIDENSRFTQKDDSNFTNIFIKNFSRELDDDKLMQMFADFGRITSAKVMCDEHGKSKGFGFVCFKEHQAAKKACTALNNSKLNDRTIYVGRALKKEEREMQKLIAIDEMRKSKGIEYTYVFVKNFGQELDDDKLQEMFAEYGEITTAKVMMDEHGKSKRFGFVCFKEHQAAKKACTALNNSKLNDRTIYVGRALKKEEREMQNLIAIDEMRKSKGIEFTNVFVKNFGQELDDNKLQEMFAEYGEITSAKVMTDEHGKSKGFGFVCFKEPEGAKKACDSLHASEVHGRTIHVCRAQKKAERQTEQRMERAARYASGVNLYVKNLDDSIDDEHLQKEFSVFGNITSAKVMTDKTARSKGFGFVCFTNSEEASKAITEMNDKVVSNKPLYVALAQSNKADCRQHVVSQYMQRLIQFPGRINIIPMKPTMMQQAQPFPHSYQLLPSQLPRNQNTMPLMQNLAQRCTLRSGPTEMQQEAPNRYLICTGMMPSTMQYVCLQAQALNPTTIGNLSTPIIGGHVASSVDQLQQSPHMTSVVAGAANCPIQVSTQYQRAAIGPEQNLNVRPRMKCLACGYNQTVHKGGDANMPIGGEQIMSGGQADQQISHHEPLTTPKLAAAASQEQKQMLGERLYRLVHAIHPDSNRKIIEMLLENKTSELLPSADSVDSRVDDAVTMLHTHQSKTGAAGSAGPSAAAAGNNSVANGEVASGDKK